MKEILNITLTICIAFIVCNYVNYKHELIRKWVDSRVVAITGYENDHGGTGVHVKAHSGKTYILTNAHICAMGRVFVSVSSSRIERKTIAVSPYSDLCLIEAVPEVQGLELSKRPALIGDDVSIIGHPLLLHIHESKGTILDLRSVDVFDHHIGACDQPKNVFHDGACFVRVMAYEATNPTYPGNSGSPVIDEDGYLVALVFADVVQTHWGLFITWDDLSNFLRDF